MSALARVRTWASRLLHGEETETSAPYAAVPREAWLVLLVVVFGLLLRWLGLRLGLPYFHHWDEILVTQSARGMVERGDDVPANYFYGAPLMRLTALGYVLAKKLHLPPPFTGPLADEVTLRWVGRAISSTLAGTGTLAAYLAARFSLGRGRAALFAALSYAVAAELVWHARYLVTDASVVALSTWTLAFTAAYLRRRTLAFAALAILTAGLTFGFKLTGLATVVLPIAALVLRPAAGVLTEGDVADARVLTAAQRALAAAAAPLVLFLFLRTNPHVRDQWQQAFSQFEGIARHYRQGHVKPFAERDAGLPHLASATYFVLVQSFHTNALAGALYGAAGVLGVGIALRRANLAVLLALGHAASVVFAMAWPNRAYLTRMYLPAMPVLCLGLGLALDEALSLAEKRLGSPRALAAALVVLLSGTTVVQAIETQRGAVDTRVRAVDVVAAAARARPVTVAFSPALMGGLALGGHGGIRAYLERPGVTIVREVATADAARESGADYLVTASYRDLKRIWPYEEQWSFTEVPGYREIARFASSPYEERYDLQPTWDGHVSAIVLERVRP